MTIHVDVDVPEITIQHVIIETVQKAFESNQYSGKGVGYTAVVAQTTGIVKSLDFTPYIKEEIKKQLEYGIIAEVVKESLKTEIKKAIKEVKHEHGLFQNGGKI